MVGPLNKNFTSYCPTQMGYHAMKQETDQVTKHLIRLKSKIVMDSDWFEITTLKSYNG